MKLSQKELKAFSGDIGAMFTFAAEQGCTAVHVHLGDIEGHDIDAARRNLDALKSCAERAGIGLKLSA